MASKWRKVKMALGLNTCLYVPQTLADSSPSENGGARLSDAVARSPSLSSAGSGPNSRPMTPTPTSSGLRISRSGSRSSKRTCAICLNTMKTGQGHALFTAECSHSFHFHCITSNVKHGNQICPICRAKWKEIPFQNPSSDLSLVIPRTLAPDGTWVRDLRTLPSPPMDAARQILSPFHTTEPAIFDDDEAIDNQHGITERSISNKRDTADNNTSVGKLDLKTYPEVSAVLKSASHDNFSILVHTKAPITLSSSPSQQPLRTPIDLVTVLDVSGSMAGTKLALLKRAMGFVINNLGPLDRLSVVSFSSTARRLFPLRRMTDTGRQQALEAVNSLTSNGGTNIAEGLKKGSKVLVDRKWKNPVISIILLSDGRDTYSVNNAGDGRSRTDYHSLLPRSFHRNNGAAGLQMPVHAFGFGADHDADTMHSISEVSGGTFSFIETEHVIQDAFAQCIGGLLSVVVQELQIIVDCVHPSLQLGSIKAGSYETNITGNVRTGSVCFGDLYAEEERDFLVTVNIPVDGSPGNEMSLLNVRCEFKDPITKQTLTMLGLDSEVKIQRPDVIDDSVVVVVSLEVDRQRNRFLAAEAMGEARVAAERADLAGAVALLEICHKKLLETASAQAGDRLCIALINELKEMQERMASRRVYESSGRAYVLSGLSSHSLQRATARGDSTDSGSLVQAYQTPNMVTMVTRSQTLVFDDTVPRRTLLPQRSMPLPRQR